MLISDWSADVCSSDLHVVVLLYADTALGAAADLVDVLLEAAQGFQLALEDHGVVAQHADRLVAPDHALHDHAAGHGAELGTAEYVADLRSEEHTSELQSLMRISYAVFCLKKKTYHT